MMDFFVREARAVIDGPMAVVRFGTCGGLVEAAPEGSVVVASGGSSYICRNYDFFPIDPSSGSSEEPYKIHRVCNSFIHIESFQC
jgi:uridine phosphorylase